MRVFVNNLDWTFAKTYADVCPHEYIAKNKLDPVSQVRFTEVVSFIKEAGFEVSYEGHPGKYYIFDKNYYWTMGEPFELTTILNRAKLIDYTLVDKNWIWKGK